MTVLGCIRLRYLSFLLAVECAHTHITHTHHTRISHPLRNPRGKNKVCPKQQQQIKLNDTLTLQTSCFCRMSLLHVIHSFTKTLPCHLGNNWLVMECVQVCVCVCATLRRVVKQFFSLCHTVSSEVSAMLIIESFHYQAPWLALCTFSVIWLLFTPKYFL